jgi:hypothetical protein
MKYSAPMHLLLATVLLVLVTDVCNIHAHAQQAPAKLSADAEEAAAGYRNSPSHTNATKTARATV